MLMYVYMHLPNLAVTETACVEISTVTKPIEQSSEQAAVVASKKTTNPVFA